MAWRFKASKYKNAAPIVPKPENCVRDIFVGSYQTYGNNITASAAFMAFNVDHNGSSLGVLPIDDCGRKGKTMPLLHAHTDTVTDMDFSHFHDGLLATGSQDCMVKVWVIGEKGLEESLTNPEVTFPHRQRRVECVRWHPTALALLSTSSGSVTTLWDVIQEKQLYSHNGDKGLIQSLSWQNEGTSLALHTKDKYLYVLDPRTDKITLGTESHQSIKDSRVVWLGSTNRILTTGFDSQRQREVYIRDIRNFSTPEKTLVLDSSTGILIPLYDPDTGMLFLAGKGDTSISYLEVTDREPYLVEGLRHTGEQTKGACLVSKRALNIMQGEVNRVLQLTSSSIVPIMYQVPRKSYRDFHSDLYPDTTGPECRLIASSWMEGMDCPLTKISLDPAQNNLKPRLGPKPFCVPKFDGEPGDTPDSTAPDAVSDAAPTPVEITPEETKRKVPDDLKLTNENKPETKPRMDNGNCPMQNGTAVNGTNHDHDHTPETEENQAEFERGGSRASIAERRRMYEGRSQSVQEPVQVSPVPLRRRDSLKNLQPTLKEEEPVRANQTKSSPPTPAAPKRTSTVFGRVSKYRHLKGTPAHKSLFIENVRNISRQISGECDGFHGNKERLAMPLGGAGGKIAVLELSRAGKLPDGVLPTLVNGSNVMDFAWDPFNHNRLAVGCDDGTLRLWHIPPGGLTEPTNSPAAVLQAHNEKIYCLKWHPIASDILVTTSYDQTTKVWDLTTGRPAHLIHQDDQVVALGWSSCGRYLSTVTRGSVIRVYEPRVSEQPIMEGKGPGGSRGARILWTLQGSFIIVTGFDKVSERQIMAFRSDDLSSPLGLVSLDVSPAILIPYYDEDSSTLFLTGRGDSTIYAFEVSDEAPYLNALSHHRCSSTHQGLAFLTKNCCDVASVEFAKAYRLSNTTIEPLSFTVPRIKSDFFQDDLFPETKVIWEATMSSSDWLNGSNSQPPRISLKPPNMESLTESQGSPGSSSVQVAKEEAKPPPGVRAPAGAWGDQSAVKQTQQQIEKSVSKKMEVNLKLEQDNMEGVDETEWVE